MILTLSVDYDDAVTARSIYESVEPDNKGYVESSINGGTLTFVIEAESAGTLRNAADDLMACIKTAESASGLVAGPVPDLDGDPFPE